MGFDYHSRISRRALVGLAALLLVTLYAPMMSAAQDERQSETALAALVSQQQKLQAGDGAASDAYGYKVALSGNTAVIGAPLNDNDGKSDQGAIYVYVNQNNAWTQQAKLIISDGNVNSQLGYALAIDGDTIVAGARANAPQNKGAAYVFVRSNGQWSQQASLIGNDTVNGDRFGEAVAISGNTIIVGAILHDVAGTPDVNKGAAYVFTRSGASWIQQAKLTPGDPQAFDFFGADIAVDGNTALVGAPQGSGVTDFAGRAYIFVRAGGTWAQQAKLQPADAGKNDGFGRALSLSGDTAVVASPAATINGSPFQGAVYIYARTGATWSQQTRLTTSDGGNNAYVGCSLSLKNERLAVGAYGSRIDGKTQQGAAYLFTRTGSTWSQQSKFAANDGAAQDALGVSVAVDGDLLVAGAPQRLVALNNTANIPQPGGAYLFSTIAGGPVPKILTVIVKGKKLLVRGLDFESPAEILINGESQKKTANDPDNPAELVIAAKSGRLIAPGATVIVQVRNSNTGKTSTEFLYTRPVE